MNVLTGCAMDSFLDFLAFLKIVPFFLYLVVRYVVSLSIVLNAALRTSMGYCGSRKMMALALALSLPILIANFTLQIKTTDPRFYIIYVLTALSLVSLYFWWRAMKGTPAEIRHSGYEPLTIIAACVFWLVILVLYVLKHGLIAH